jgi:hypothetical protein
MAVVMPTLGVDHQMADMSGSPPVTRDDWTFELQGLRGRGFIRAGTLSEWQMSGQRCVECALRRPIQPAIGAGGGAEKSLTNYCTISCTIPDTGG